MAIGPPPIGSGAYGTILPVVPTVPFVSTWYGTGYATQNISTSAMIFGFRAPINCAVTQIRLFVASVAGTVASGDIRFELLAATEGQSYSPYPPVTGGTVLQTLYAPAISSSGFVSINPPSIPALNTMTAGLYYYVRVRNTNATPSANYIGVRMADVVRIDTHAPVVGVAATTASSWSSVYSRVPSFAIQVSDVEEGTGGTYVIGIAADLAPSSVVNSYGSGATARLCGTRITVPSDYSLRVLGVTYVVSGGGAGAPAAASIWQVSNNTEVASSEVIPSGVLRYYGHRTFWFSSTVTLSAGQDYRVVLKPTSGTSSNYFTWRYIGVDSSYSPTSAHPLNPRTTYSTNGGSTWTDTTDNSQLPMTFVLWLDPSQPIVATGGGGGGFTGFAPTFWRGVET